MRVNVLGKEMDFKNVQEYQEHCRGLIKQKEARRVELKDEDKKLKKEIKELKNDTGEIDKEEAVAVEQK